MKDYILRRLLLIVPTLFGISLICFTLIQFVPGGPVEDMIARIRSVGGEKGMNAQHNITAEEVENIKTYFGFDQPAPVRYYRWLKKICVLDLGVSYTYREPVWNVILSKLPISFFIGLTSLLISNLVCIPLGYFKALYHGKKFDTISSLFIFTGYVIPGYVVGILLIILFGGGSYWNWFPISGIVSDNFEEFSAWGKLIDFLHHMFLPMFCFMLGEFAFLTMMIKNSLLEEMHKDYMRTALVKGASFKRAVWKHAFRNALIPLATRAGDIFLMVIGSSVLIEKVFDIDGMGLLIYNSTVNRDYNVVMGIILLTSILALMGRLLSDILYVWADPRIRLS